MWWDEDGKLRIAWRIVLGIFLAIAADILAADIANAAANSPRSFQALYRPVLLILLLGAFCAMLLFADRIRHNPLQALGLGRRHAVRDSVIGFFIGGAAICAGVSVIGVVGHLRFNASARGPAIELLLVELFILLTGAMAEELIFRGYPFQRILEAAGPVVAIAVLSVFFGVAHHWNPHARDVGAFALLNTIFVGILLCLAYLRARNLWLPWGIHFGWNAVLGVAFGLPVSGLTEFAVVVHGKATGPLWLTGGAYGIEGGVAGTIAIAVAFLPLLWCTRRRTGEATGA